MTHFIIYSRRTSFSTDEVRRIAETAGVDVLDDMVEGAVLVDATPEEAEQLRDQLPECIISEETEYPPPDLQPYEIKGD